jgi:hypothetical protein
MHLAGKPERHDPTATASDGGPDCDGAGIPPISRVRLGPTGAGRAEGIGRHPLAVDGPGSVDQERLCGTGAEVEAEEHLNPQPLALFFADSSAPSR